MHDTNEAGVKGKDGGVERSANSGRQGLKTLAGVVVGALLLLSCAPAPSRGTPASSPGATSQPKVLRIGLQADREPASPAMFGSSGSGSSALEGYFVFHAGLTVYDPSGAPIPQLAQKVPSLQDGDWKLRPEGGMEVTWVLKPGLTWHDGVALTTADFVFGFQLNTDPDLLAIPGELANIASVLAVDERTLVVTWRTTTIAGGVSGYDGIPAAPRHIFGELYASGDKTALQNSPYWSTQWVGLGPYRLTQWSRGVFMEGTAFDQFVGGRPRIDRVLLMFLGDANAMVAHILSGDIDIIPLGAQLDVPPLATVRQTWAASNGGTTGAVAKGVRTLYLQLRDPSAPWAQDVRVRQAMLHALDRDDIVENLEAGLTQRADFFVPIGDPVLSLAASRGLPTFPYDPNRAAQLMSEAGWSRGADGVFRGGTGTPFSISIATSNEGSNAQEAAIVASQLSAAGLTAQPAPYFQTTTNRNELAMSFPGALIKPWNFTIAAPGNLRQSQIGTAQNAWAGNNYGGYVNQGYEDLYRLYANELEAGKRQEALFQIVKLIDEQLPVLPIFYVPQTYAFRKGVTGPGPTAYLQAASAWNIATWDID